MHEAFVRVWQQRGRVDVARLDALVYASALNLARNHLRWRKLRHWLSLDDIDEQPGDMQPEQQVDGWWLHHALAALPMADQQLLLLSEFAGLDTRSLAKVLGIAEGTVGSRRHRAMARLRAKLGARA
jgi:RNA polymerase sigma-70 factor (ECF subfamily)